MTKSKVCPHCETSKPLSEFAYIKTRSVTYYPRCRSCDARRVVLGRHKTFRGLLAHATSAAKQRSLRMDREFSITVDDVMSVLEAQGYKCAVTGVPLSHLQPGDRTNASLDRIDSRFGYTPSNIQIVCVIVNTMKHDLSPGELAHWCHLISAG